MMVCFLVNFSFAQGGHGNSQNNGTELLNTTPITFSLLSSKEQDFYQEAINLPNVVSSQIILLGNITTLQQNGMVTFSIPNSNSTAGGVGSGINSYTATATIVEYNNNNHYSWTGNIDGGGTINIISEPNGRGGFIHLPNNDFYSIFCFPNGNGKGILSRHVDNIPAECGTSEASSGSNTTGSDDFCDSSPEDCPVVIDILVLFSQNVPLSTPFATVIGASFMEASINAAFVNSGILNKEVRINLITNFDFTFHAPPSSDIDIDNLAENQLVQTLRADHRADIVVMITNQGYVNPFFGTRRYGHAKDIGGPKEDAFVIVETPFIFGPRWTFAHEVGHILGARHETDITGTCGHGFTVVTTPPIPFSIDTFPTLLARTDAENSTSPLPHRILHYSSPDILFNMTPTGDDTHDNALVIKNLSCQVTAFEPAWEWHTLISSPDILCDEEGDAIIATALVLDGINGFTSGVPPYTYEWAWSQDGINIEEVLGNNETQSFNNPCYPCSDFFIHLTVTASNGFISETTKKINIDYFDCFIQETITDRSDETTTSNAQIATVEFLIHPNPSSSGQFTIQTKSITNHLVADIKVFNNTGILVIQYQNINLSNHWFLDLFPYQKGIYFVEINTSKATNTFKVIKH